MEMSGRYVEIEDTRLYIEELGAGLPLLVLHGGPGLDHHMFGDYLRPLSAHFRVVYVDQRSQGRSDCSPEETWTIARMAQDIVSLAKSMDLGDYAVLGHSYGALVALQNAVDFPGEVLCTIVSSGFPSASYLSHVDENLRSFEPEALRGRVAASWAKESTVKTPEEVQALLADQMPFHFADPLDARIGEYERRTADAIFTPDVLRHFSSQDYGGIEVEDRLGEITQPLLVLAGRHDRISSIDAARAIAEKAPESELVIFEKSGHMTFVEETPRYLEVVTNFLSKQKTSLEA
jgi:pimeloyl-ACP methyl ester carboxylesterase